MPCLHLHSADGAVGRIGALFKIVGLQIEKLFVLHGGFISTNCVHTCFLDLRFLIFVLAALRTRVINSLAGHKLI